MICTPNPIIRPESLLRLLRINKKHLHDILSDKERFYTSKTLTKCDKKRNVYIIKKPLKQILDTMKDTIFLNVQYPAYLHGSLPGKSPKTNASAHCGAVSAVLMDIQSFFPSITCEHVYYMFRHRFQFSKKVSKMLADIITYDGRLPQGSPVSSYIANLALRGEGELYRSLVAKNYCYTRYVDDIAISSRSSLSEVELLKIKKEVQCLIKHNNLHIKRKKTQLCRAGARIVITGLVAGSNGPRIRKEYVADVLDDIKEISSRGFHNAEIQSIQGKIQYVRQFSSSKKEGDYLDRQLRIALEN